MTSEIIPDLMQTFADYTRMLGYTSAASSSGYIIMREENYNQIVKWARRGEMRRENYERLGRKLKATRHRLKGRRG